MKFEKQWWLVCKKCGRCYIHEDRDTNQCDECLGELELKPMWFDPLNDNIAFTIDELIELRRRNNTTWDRYT